MVPKLPTMRAPFESTVRIMDEAREQREPVAPRVEPPEPPSSELGPLTEKHLALERDVLDLEAAIGRVAAASAEATWLGRRKAAMTRARSALGAVLGVGNDPAVAKLLVADAPLATYLHGLYLYFEALTSAVGTFASEARAGRVDWRSIRERNAEARHWYFDGLPNLVRSEALAANVPLHAIDKLNELFFAARLLAEGVERK